MRERRWRLLLIALLLVVASSCGTRLPDDRFEAAAVGRAAPADGIEPLVGPGRGPSDPSTASDAGIVPAAEPALESGSSGGAAANGGPGGTRSTATGDATPVVIGSVGNYSGLGGASQKPAADALRAWAAATNARGGVSGHPIELYVVDDQGDPAQQLAAVRDLVESKGVVAFVDQFAALTIDASADYLRQKRIPVVGGSGSEPVWNTNPMFFSVVSPNAESMYGQLVAGQPFSQGDRLGVLACQEVAVCTDAQSQAETAAPRAGYTLAYNGNASLTQPDYTAECLQMRNAEVDAVVLIFDASGVRRIIDSCARQSVRPLWLLPSVTVDETSAADPAYDGAVSLMLTAPFIAASNPALDEFHAAMEEYYPDQPRQPAQAAGWAGAKLFERVAAIAAAAGGPITTAGLLDALWSLQNETAGGLIQPVSYERGQPTPRFKCWFVLRVVRGAWVAPYGASPQCP